MGPWKQFLMNIANLIEVKTILTLVIVLSFCYKTLQGVELTSEYVMIASAVVTYYFTHNSNNKENKNT